MTTLLVCGGRTWGAGYKRVSGVYGPNVQASIEREAVYAMLDQAVKWWGVDRLVFGDASGADQCALDWALSHDLPYERFRAEWDTHGRAAGPLRNQRMLDQGRPNIVLAFPGGDGTADMVARAKRLGIKVYEVPA